MMVVLALPVLNVHRVLAEDRIVAVPMANSWDVQIVTHTVVAQNVVKGFMGKNLLAKIASAPKLTHCVTNVQVA